MLSASMIGWLIGSALGCYMGCIINVFIVILMHRDIELCTTANAALKSIVWPWTLYSWTRHDKYRQR